MNLHASTKSSRLITATPFFYGWVILAAGTIGIVMIGPSQTFTVGIFLDIFIADLGISRANMSLIYGLATLMAAFSLPAMGRQVDRYGPRRIALIAAFFLGLASIGMTWITGVASIFVGFFALRFFGFGSLQLVSNNIIAQWFIRRRGLVMGISGLSLSISLIIFPTLTEYLIGQFDWRGTWVALGFLVWLVMLPLGWFLFKDRPEQYGLLPDGDAQPLGGEMRPPIASERNWTLAEARRTGVFWLFLVALSTMAMILAGFVFHQLSLFTARGLSRETAINAFAIIAIFAVIGNLGMGRLLDKFSARLLLAIALSCLAAAMTLAQVMTAPSHAFILAACVGLVSGSFRVIDSTVWAKYFGRLHLGSIKGATSIGIIGCTALGPYLLGVSWDYLGSYNVALSGFLALSLTISLVAFVVRRPEKQP